MPPKAYVLLADFGARTIHVPVKANVNRATGQPIGYCPGCPQILGGTIPLGGQWPQTLQAEVQEETVGTYALNLQTLPVQFYAQQVGGSVYTFYSQPRQTPGGVIGWTGAPSSPLPMPPPDSPYAWGEMEAMVDVEWEYIPVGVDLPVLADALIALTDAHPTPEARTQFIGSATLLAFQAFVAQLPHDALPTSEERPT